ncbi:hypothetical protein PBCVNEJV1_353L [Paramecium bursaria Chlorella virus NE-JV-1]|nr:hypothetical protein PBCVNEJV1_353L [Paramecium bursaria Chlorella virus NE-JV-1]
MNYLYVVIAFAIVLFVVWFFTMRKEMFSEFPGTNNFMKIYYEDVAEDPKLVKKFPFYGTGNKTGLRCRKPGNVGCDTMWLSGRLVEITPALVKEIECKYGKKFDKVITTMI